MSDNHTIHPLEATVKAEDSPVGGYTVQQWEMASGQPLMMVLYNGRNGAGPDMALARRIAAALNAVEGIPTAALEHGAVVGLIDAITNAAMRLARGRTVGHELTPAQLVEIEDALWAAQQAIYGTVAGSDTPEEGQDDGQPDER